MKGKWPGFPESESGSERASESGYLRGYEQGRYDVLFDLGMYLRGDMVEDLSTGKRSDPVASDLADAFAKMGLKKGSLCPTATSAQ